MNSASDKPTFPPLKSALETHDRDHLEIALADGTLEQVTRDRLAEFHRRRVLLKQLRGTAVTAVLLVTILLAAILLDGFIDHPVVRPMAGVTFYLVCMAVAYGTIYRPSRATCELPVEAAALERRYPRLRDRLLSAVELSETSLYDGRDSVAFREELQKQVGSLIANVDVSRLLPLRTIRGWLAFGGLGLLWLLALCCVPSLGLPHRIVRTLLPFANLGRVSHIAIELQRPMPGSKTVPLGDVIAVQALVRGPQPDSVWLETRANGQTVQIPMTTVNGSPSVKDAGRRETSFETTLPADREQIDYRIVSQGASTAWHQLRARPRPEVVGFVKTIQLPAYAASPAMTLEEPHGNIAALAGSRCEIAIEVNQPVSVAQIRWQSHSEESSGPLETTRNAGRNPAEVDADRPPVELTWNEIRRRYVGEFAVNESDHYRIFLQSSETKFTNAFSPSYEVIALTDSPASVQWVQPESATLTTASSEIVPLSVSVSDELPVLQIEQWSRINAGDWQKSTLDVSDPESARQIQAWQFDLLPFDLKAGDLLETKIVARDRNELSGESSILQIWISSTFIQVDADSAEESKTQLADALDRFAAEVLRISEEREPEKAVDAGVRGSAELLSDKLRAELPGLLELDISAANQCSQSTDITELRMIGEVVTRLLTVDSVQLENAAREKTDAEIAHQQIRQTSARIKLLASHARALATHDIAKRHAEHIHQLSVAYQRLSEEPAADVDRLRRLHEVVNRQMRSVQQSMLDSAPKLHASSQLRFRQSAERLGLLSDQLQRQQPYQQAPALRELARSTAQDLDSQRLLSRIDGNIYENLKSAHRWLDENSAAADRSILELARELGQTPPGTEIAGHQPAVTLEDLAMRRRIMRAGQSVDREFAKDLGDARRALSMLFDTSHDSQQQAQTALRIGSAVSVLSAADQINTSVSHLSQLIKREQWNLDDAAAFTENPRAWDAFLIRLERAARLVEMAGLPNPLVDRLEMLRSENMAERASEKITSRRWEVRDPISAATELEELQAGLLQMQRELTPWILEARRTLRESAPTISQLAFKAAQETKNLAGQTEDFRDQLDRREVPNLDRRAEQLAQQIQDTLTPIDDLREALVDEAEAQDLLDKGQLARARQADAGLDVAQRAGEQIETSLDELPEHVGANVETSQALTAAADEQFAASSALEQLATLLDDSPGSEALQTPDESSKRLQRLQELAESLGTSAQPTDRESLFRDAETLAEMAETDPQEVLEALEERLKTDEPMQSEMSDIARAAVQQALEDLHQAASQQAEVQPGLEASDAELLARKTLLLHDLQAIREDATQMLGLILSECKWTSAAAKQSQLADRLTQMDQSLQAAVDASAQASLAQPFDLLQEKARVLHAALRSLQERLDGAQPVLQEASRENFHQNGADLNNRRREMKDRQRRIYQQDSRHAQSSERNQQQRLRQAENEKRQVAQSIVSAEEKREEFKARLSSQTEQNFAEEQLRSQDAQLTNLRQSEAAIAMTRDQIEQRVASAQQLVEETNNRQLDDLSSTNPSAQLAEILIRLGAQRSSLLAERLEFWLGSDLLEYQAAISQLIASSDRQSAIIKDVEHAASHLARAGRHEARLENVPISEQLAAVARQVDGVVADELSTAQTQFSKAVAQARQTDSSTRFATASATHSAANASAAAEQAIQSSAAAVKKLLGETVPADAPPESASPSQPSESGTPESPLNSQQMARLLDELDRQLNQEPELGEKEDNSPNPDNPSPDQSSPGTLSEAAKQLAQQMSRNREDPTANASTDFGMATDSQVSNVNPQGPVDVQVIPVDRIDGNWGELRARRAQGSIESRAEAMAPQYREQVEAYFQSLASEK